MFKQLKRIVYPVADLARAKAWYSEFLGYPPLFDAPFAAIFTVGSCSLSLAQARPGAGSPSANPVPAANPPPDVYWEVDNVDAALERLLQMGATLLTPVAAMLNIRTAKVVDPFGNILGLTDQGSPDSRKSVDRKPSDTAVTVAFCRALAAREDRPWLQGPDTLADIFLNPEAKLLLAQADRRRWAIDSLVTSPLYGYFLARTAWIEAAFTDACRQGLPQIVLLGAGYDTRAIRHQAELTATRVFEMDIPTTQNNKLAKLREAGIATPDTLTYVPIDFEKESIAAALSQAGYNPALPTLFIWEGVAYYLTRESVAATLRFFQENAAAGSSLLFDCLSEELQSVNATEPFLFWLPPQDLAALLSSYGLRLAETLDAEAMTRRYLTATDGTPSEKCLPAFYLIRAEK